MGVNVQVSGWSSGFGCRAGGCRFPKCTCGDVQQLDVAGKEFLSHKKKKKSFRQQSNKIKTRVGHSIVTTRE